MNHTLHMRGAVALFSGGHGKPQLRPFPFTTHRDLPECSLAGEQPSRAATGPSNNVEPPNTGDHSFDQTSFDQTSFDQTAFDHTSFNHTSVMFSEMLDVFDNAPDGVIVDATLGAGGHTEGLLDRYPGLTVIGLDRDLNAIAAATKRLKRFGARFVAHHIRFDDLATVIEPQSVDGVMFDLGVSSPQLDHPDRGFSHRFDGPLDMRMDSSDSLSAADIVNTYDEVDIAHLLRLNADERFGRRIAAGIVAARPISTTAELVDVVVNSVPAAARRQPRHPAMRTFQAIRIEVNSELEILEPALSSAVDVLRPGGRLAVLAYHSGEDRIVKRLLREESRTSPVGRPDLPPPTGTITRLRLLWSGAHKPGEDEIAANPRSSSARFRAAERTEQGS